MLALLPAMLCACAAQAAGASHDLAATPAWTAGSLACVIFADGFEAAARPWLADGDAIEYSTRGHWLVRVNHTTITVIDPLRFNFADHWGDPHENVDGKHIKDWGGLPEWDGDRRSILLDDGTKITMEALASDAVVDRTSIYDGAHHLDIDNANSTIVHEGDDPDETAARDAAQYDGETVAFSVDLQTGVATYTDVYDEYADFHVVEIGYLLADTGGCAHPEQVNDYFP